MNLPGKQHAVPSCDRGTRDREAPDPTTELRDLAAAVRRLSPNWTNPEAYYEARSEISGSLLRLSRRWDVAPAPIPRPSAPAHPASPPSPAPRPAMPPDRVTVRLSVADLRLIRAWAARRRRPRRPDPRQRCLDLHDNQGDAA
jgi:hypothetical protein